MDARELWGPWQPKPLPQDAALLQAVDLECRREMPLLITAGFRLLVVDARGRGLLQAVFGEPSGRIATCEDIPVLSDGTLGPPGVGSRTEANVIGPPRPPATSELLDAGGGERVRGPGGEVIVSVTYGAAGSDISSVVIQMPGHGQFTASLASGGYVAWWPGPWPAGSRVLGLNARGVVVDSVSLPIPEPHGEIPARQAVRAAS